MAKYMRQSDFNVIRAGLVLSEFKLESRGGIACAPKHPDNPKLATAFINCIIILIINYGQLKEGNQHQHSGMHVQIK
jgi:hypothetical protein